MKYSKSQFFPFLIVFYEIATYLSNDMYLPALPQMMKDLQLSLSQVQLTLTSWFIGSASMPLIMGAISDHYGRKPTLLGGGIIYILATIVCAISSNFYLFLIARGFEGGMVASVLVPGYSSIHELYEQREAIRILALMGSIAVLAPALGPLFGSIILYFFSWRSIFWIIAIWAGFSIFLLKLWMPETLPSVKRQPIHLGILFNNYGHILTNKRFMLFMSVLGFNFCGFLAWVTAGPLLVIENFHYNAIFFGFIQAIVFASYIHGSRWVKYLLAKLDIIVLIRLGLSITLSGGLLTLLSALCFPNYLYSFIFAMIVYAFGSALCFAPLNRCIIEASSEPMGIRVSLFTVFLTSFAALGSGLTSLFFNGTIFSLAAIIVISILFACISKLFLMRIS